MMSGEKLNASAAGGSSSFEDHPPEYSQTIGSDPKSLLDQISMGGDSKGSEKMATEHPFHTMYQLYSMCTRCKAPIEASQYHYGCQKCVHIIECICQKCWNGLPTCRIHHIDLVKRYLKARPTLPLWTDYISSIPTKHDNPLIHALKSHDDNLTTFHASDASFLNAHTYLGYTPLHFAAHLGLVSGTSILLSHGALINSRDENNMTPLVLAITLNQPQIVNLLLQSKANIHSFCGFPETTALHAAATSGSPALVSLLLDNGAIIDTPSVMGTALQLASRVGSFESASILLERGANPNARSEVPLGEPPIISAVRNQSTELVDLLVKYGANINLPYIGKQDEFTALYIAVTFDRQDMARKLIGYGADVNWRGKRDNTCLMRATALGWTKMCGILIDEGVEIDMENQVGMNAVLFAAILGAEDMLDVLLKKGASGKPPKICRGKWKSLESFWKKLENRDVRKKLSRETKNRILKTLGAAKHR